MTHRVAVRRRQKYRLEAARIEQAARSALEHIGAPPGGLTVVLESDGFVHDLNHRFRGVDSTTDVLSFPDGSDDVDEGGISFGDVVIAVPYARENARRKNRSAIEELEMLTVHGVLHLLGFDHTDPSGRRQMEGLQAEILDALRETHAGVTKA